MKRLLKIAVWLAVSLAGASAVAIAVFIGIDRLQINRAVRSARSFPTERIERMVVDARELAKTESAGWRVVQTKATPFADTGAKYAVVMPHRVDLVFYKAFEDEVALYIHVDPACVELATPSRDGARIQRLWPTKPNSLQHNAGTAPFADEALPPRG